MANSDPPIRADLDGKVKAVERLTNLFWPERLVYICFAIVAFIMLFGFVTSAFISKEHDVSTLIGEFGPSGIVAFTSSRVLVMWSKAMSIVSTSDPKSGT